MEVARIMGVSEGTVRNRRKELGFPPSMARRRRAGGATAQPFTPPPATEIDTDDLLGKVKMDYDFGTGEGEFRDVIVEGELKSWDHIFEFMELDPDEFEIADDTIKASVWQQSALDKNTGERSTVKLRSYRARFRKRVEAPIPREDVAELIEYARSWRLPSAPPKLPGTPVAAILNLADMQLFKAEGGGVKATLARLDHALTSFRHHIDEVRARGLNLNELVIVNNGDPFEGIAGNYANQAHTVEGGLRAQMNAVLDVWLMFARELYPLFERRQFVSVLCNHTQFGRQGGAKDAITGDEDNGGAFLAETLERILHATPGFEDVRFTIPHDEMNVYTGAAGIPLGFNHGHKIPKSDASGFEQWLNGQVRYDERAHAVRLWVTAHRHNLQMFDLGSTSVLQTPSCDGGSKWLTDTTGKHSNSGVVSILVGEHHRLGWSDLTFL